MKTIAIFIMTIALWVFKLFFAFLIVAPLVKWLFNPSGFSWSLYGYVLLVLFIVYLICLAFTFIFNKTSK
jgi:hypothetical protein